MKWIFIWLLLLVHYAAHSQQGNKLFINGYTHGLSEANLSEANFLAGGLNPACLGYTDSWNLQAGAMQSFLLKNLYNAHLATDFRLNKNQVAGVSFYYGGKTIYHELQLTAAYSLRLAKHTYIGLALHGMSFVAPEVKAHYSGTFTLGIQSMIGEEVSLGMSTFNPVGFFREEKNNDLSRQVALGVGYHPADYLAFFLSGRLTNEYPLSISGGVAYTINKRLQLYVSASSQPAQFGVGIGYRLSDKSRLDLSATQHLQLGLSPAFSYAYGK